MNLQELLSDPSIIRNEEGNILCIKIRNQREHHLNPQMVINESRMANEGWMIKRKIISNGNGKSDSNYNYSVNAIPVNPPETASYLSVPIVPTDDVPPPEITKKEVINTHDPVTGFPATIILETDIPKKKGGRPVGSKNKKTKKVKA